MQGGVQVGSGETTFTDSTRRPQASDYRRYSQKEGGGVVGDAPLSHQVVTFQK